MELPVSILRQISLYLSLEKVIKAFKMRKNYPGSSRTDPADLSLHQFLPLLSSEANQHAFKTFRLES